MRSFNGITPIATWTSLVASSENRELSQHPEQCLAQGECTIRVINNMSISIYAYTFMFMLSAWQLPRAQMNGRGPREKAVAPFTGVGRLHVGHRAGAPSLMLVLLRLFQLVC